MRFHLQTPSRSGFIKLFLLLAFLSGVGTYGLWLPSQKNSVTFSATSQFNDFLAPSGHGREEEDDCPSTPNQPEPEGGERCGRRMSEGDGSGGVVNAFYVDHGQTEEDCPSGGPPPSYADLSSVDRPSDPGGGSAASSAGSVTPPNLMPEISNEKNPENARNIWIEPLKQDSPSVSAATGEMTWDEVDFYLPGSGPNFVLKRTYKSGLSGYQSLYGVGWEMSIHRWVRKPATGNNLYVTSGMGPVSEYLEETSGSTWYVREGAKDVYEFLAASGGEPDALIRYEPSGNRETYERLDPLEDYFYVTQYEDLAGNKITFTYEDSGSVVGFPTSRRLDFVTDTMGRTIDFAYHGPEGICITDIEIKDWNGQSMGTIEYVYKDVTKNGTGYRTLIEVKGLKVGTEGSAGAWDRVKPIRKYEYDWKVVNGSLDIPLLSRIRSPRAHQHVTREWEYADPSQGSGWEVKKQIDGPGSAHEAVHEYLYHTDYVVYVGPHGFSTEFHRDPGQSRISFRRDHLDSTGTNFAVTKWEYDTSCGCSRVKKVIYPDGSERHYDYDENGNLNIEWLKEAGGTNYRLQKFSYSKFDPQNGLYFSRLLRHELWRDAGTETPGNACSDPGCNDEEEPPGQLLYEYTYNNLGLLTHATYGAVIDRFGAGANNLFRSQEFLYAQDVNDNVYRLRERLDKVNGTLVKRTEYIYGNNAPFVEAVVSSNPTNTESWGSTYTRDAWGRIVTAVGNTGVVRKREWDEAGNLLAVHDDWDGATQTARRTTKNYYDLTSWRAKEVRSSEGLSDTIESLRNDRGFLAELRFTGSQGITKSTFFEYDSDGKLTKTTSWDGSVVGTDFGFGVYRLPTKIWRELRDQSGNVLSAKQDVWLSGDGGNDSGYDLMGRPTSARNAAGWKSYFTYDSFGRSSQSWSQTHAAGSGHDQLYDASRRLYNARGFVKEIEYGRIEGTDPSHIQSVVWETHEKIRRNSLGHVLLQSMYISGETEPARLAAMIVDGLGRTKERQEYFGDRAQGITNASYVNRKASYNAIGQITEVGKYDAVGTLLARSTFDYRDALRESEIVVEEGGRSWKVVTSKDTLGRPTQTTSWNLGETESQTVTKEYDGFGRIVAMVDAMGLRNEWDYDQYGRVIVERLVPMATGGGPSTSKETSYSWDADTGVLNSVTDAEGKVTNFTYHDDHFRLLKQTTYADGRFEKISLYDVLDRPLQTEDSRGVIHDLTYDYQRLVRNDANPGSGNGAVGPHALEWIFDTAGNDLIETRTLDAQDSVLWKTQYQFNDLGELLSETQGPNGLEHTWSWTHGFGGELHTVDYPSGLGIAKGVLSYDAYGRLGSVSYEDAFQAPLASYALGYDGTRFASRDETVSQTRLEVNLDAWGRIDEIEWGTNSSGFTALEGSYQAYDAVGRVIAKQRLTETNGEVFEHDSYGRLKAWYQGVSNALQHVPGNPPTTWTEVERYTLDKVYAREKVEVEMNGGSTTATNYGTDDAHFYTTVGGVARTKEGGHLATDGTYAYAYDAWGQLIAVRDQQTGALVKTHTYDAKGRRVRTVHHTPSPDVVERLVYWGSRLAATYNESSQETKTYGYVGGADGEAFVEITGSATYDGTYHLVRNFQGSVIALADAGGTLLESYSYTAFGKPTITDVGTSQVITESAYGLDRLFLGRPYDAEVGLYDLRARWYDTRTGSFLSPDPLGAIDSWNLYQYGFGTPNTWMDPFGLSADGIPRIPEWELSVTGKDVNIHALPLGDGKWMIFRDEEACKKDDCSRGQCKEWKNDDDTKDKNYWHAEDGEIIEPDHPLAQALQAELEKLGRDEQLLLFADGLDLFAAALSVTGPAGALVGAGLSLLAIALRDEAGYYDDNETSKWADLALAVSGAAKGLGFLKGTGKAARGGAKPKYHPRIRERALQDPRAHNFPYSFDDAILKQPPIKQADGSLLHRLKGSLNGKDGFFEIAINPETNTIFHRTFSGN